MSGRDDAAAADPTEGSSGDMGVSSERVGATGPGQVGTDGVLDVGEQQREPGAEVPPEQAADGEDALPDSPIPPVAGYSSHDERSEDHPFHTEGPRSEGGA